MHHFIRSIFQHLSFSTFVFMCVCVLFVCLFSLSHFMILIFFSSFVSAVYLCQLYVLFYFIALVLAPLRKPMSNTLKIGRNAFGFCYYFVLAKKVGTKTFIKNQINVIHSFGQFHMIFWSSFCPSKKQILN